MVRRNVSERRNSMFSRRAKDISGKTWFNLEALPEAAQKRIQAGKDLRIRKDLAGFVVLIIFWDYGCNNCIHVLEYLRKWWDKYEKNNFLIIGVHTPEFEYGKEADNVQSAVLRFRLDFPVVSDPEYINWDEYGNSVWPHLFLVSKRGRIKLDHEGEGEYENIEATIQKLLKK